MSNNIVKATIYGQEYTLVYNAETGNYEAEVTAPSDSSYRHNSGHYYPVTITATDDAGNVTTISDTEGSFTEELKLYVKEQIKPTITAISPSNDANITSSNPTIGFTLLDNSNGQEVGYSGINLNSLVLTVGGVTVDNSKVVATETASGYTCTYTPTEAIADGNCIVTIKVSDYDENESETATVIFKVDTTPPVLNITSPENGISVNTEEITIEGMTSDENSTPVTVTISVNDVDQGDVIVASDGSFSKTVTLNTGTNTIVITSTDAAGKESAVTRTITLKTTLPIFKTVTILPNPVNCGKTYTISVSFVEE